MALPGLKGIEESFQLFCDEGVKLWVQPFLSRAPIILLKIVIRSWLLGFYSCKMLILGGLGGSGIVRLCVRFVRYVLEQYCIYSHLDYSYKILWHAQASFQGDLGWLRSSCHFRLLHMMLYYRSIYCL